MTISFRYGSTVLLAVSLVSMLTCARDQQLTSIDIVPSAETFLSPDPNSSINLRALGNYIHPPVQKDITSQVTWASNTPDLVTVTSAGVLSPAQTAVCGGALVSATVQTNTAGNRSSQGAIITGYMTTTVNNTAVQGCPGFTGGNLPILIVTISGAGQGTVAVSPGGLTCTTSQVQCSTSFAVGTQVTLTATPGSGSTFGKWTPLSCDSSPVVNECVVTMNNSRTVGAIFN
jgi:hypothetical protein